MDRFRKGLIYLNQAHKAITRDFKVAYDDGDWNIALARAQQSVEYAAKSLQLLLGEEVEKEHDLHFPAWQLEKLPVVGYALEEDPQSAVVVFVESTEGSPSIVRLWKRVGDAFTSLASAAGEQVEGPFELEINGSSIQVLKDGKVVLAATDYSGAPSGKWKPIRPPKEQIRETKTRIQHHIDSLAKQRNEAIYFDKLFSQADADYAAKQAWIVLVSSLQALGLRQPKNRTGSNT